MPEKAIADLEETSDPRYAGCPGADCEEYRYEQDEIALHNANWQQVLDQEYEEDRALCGMC